MGRAHVERHPSGGIGWLRAAVLGANDGIVSTASLLLGVASAQLESSQVVATGLAGLAAGALSMAAGEYVSVSSQADSEQADIARERRELNDDQPGEERELAAIYVKRGLSPELATQVARQLMVTDALDAHLREEHGLTERAEANPIQAAAASAASFVAGAVVPVAVAAAAPHGVLVPAIAGASLVALGVMGVLSARVGRAARPVRSVLRVVGWGALAMVVTSLVGRLFGAAV